MFDTPVDSRNLRFAKVRTEGSEHHLLSGKTVSVSPVSESSPPLAANVVKINCDKVWLELLGPPPTQAISQGDPVRIKYWDDETAYHFDAEIQSVSGRQVTTSSPREEISVQRRKAQRVCYPISFLFTIIEAADTQLIGHTVTYAEAKDVSVRGLAFHTPLALKLRDRLEVTFRLSPSERVNAVGCVVRSEPLGKEGNKQNLVALEFLHLDAEDQNKFHLFLARVITRRKASIQWFD